MANSISDKALFEGAKACPFCGGEFLYYARSAIVCDRCQTEGPFAGDPETAAELPAAIRNAVKLWNRRGVHEDWD